MASTYKTPGVHVEEISIFPPSVAEVETAIPAFIGYTKKALKNGKNILNKPTRISSLLQYAEYFGRSADPEELKVVLDDTNAVSEVVIKPKYYLYDSMRLFFANGGGDCYIVAVGEYGNPIAKDNFLVGLKALEKYDEPTLILFPDAVLLTNADDLGTLQQQTLKQCNTLQDRFGVFDVFGGNKERSRDEDDVITKFRDAIGINYLKYGAAYYPWVESTLSYPFNYAKLQLVRKNDAPVKLASITAEPKYVKSLDDAVKDQESLKPVLAEVIKDNGEVVVTSNRTELENRISALDQAIIKVLKISFKNEEIKTRMTGLKGVDSPLKIVANKLIAYNQGYPINPVLDDNVTEGDYPAAYNMNAVAPENVFGGDTVTAADKVIRGRAVFQELFDEFRSIVEDLSDGIDEILKTAEQAVKDTSLVYNTILTEVAKEAVVVPASGPMVGVYSAVDNDRGVWKAPANVSLSTVAGPTVMINSKEQEDLNVDTTAGKSINAIRAFTGKGTLVWGSRTLAGNDNEWRYIPVRRFFNMVEESVRKSTGWAVFEPNDANLWVKVKAMIENYLIDKWREGALAGSKPEQAFFVNIGLGKTMSAQDILEGRLIVEIGMAAVRPAEFIILRFSHKMQEA